MSDIYQLVGKEQRTYEKDGIKKFYCGLHFVSAQGASTGVEGSSVQTISCPQSVDPARLTIGSWYQIQYQHFRSAMGIRASVSGFTPVEVE